MKLFVSYIGGIHKDALIEVHDIRIIPGEKLEDTFDHIKKTWWGTPESLHIDAWGELNYADGYDIVISNEPPKEEQTHKLYFVNLGGYNSQEFTELHKNTFVVAESDSKAKVKALKMILDWQSHHRDYQYEIEKMLEVNQLLSSDNLYIHLIPSSEEKEFQFSCKYLAIGKQ